jgi:hypothetical protein
LTAAEIADLKRRNRILEKNEILCLRAMDLLNLALEIDLTDEELDELDDIQLQFTMNRIELDNLN